MRTECKRRRRGTHQPKQVMKSMKQIATGNATSPADSITRQTRPYTLCMEAVFDYIEDFDPHWSVDEFFESLKRAEDWGWGEKYAAFDEDNNELSLLDWAANIVFIKVTNFIPQLGSNSFDDSIDDSDENYIDDSSEE